MAFPPNVTRVVTLDASGPTVRVDGVDLGTPAVDQPSQDAIIGELTFVTPNVEATFPTLEQEDYLRGVIERGEFE
jgi:hypothetical protein